MRACVRVCVRACVRACVFVCVFICFVVVKIKAIIPQVHTYIHTGTHEIQYESKKRFQYRNTISFSKNAHETGVQRYRMTSQTICIPFLFVSFRTVPQSTVRSRNAALFVEERLPRWRACRFPATFFMLLAASWLRRKASRSLS